MNAKHGKCIDKKIPSISFFCFSSVVVDGDDYYIVVGVVVVVVVGCSWRLTILYCWIKLRLG